MGNRDRQEENNTALNDRSYRESVPALLFWYEYNARILPWREDPTPYHVWISEIMLQQTRVEAVRAYYARFLEEFPDVRAVAAASEDRLVKLWEGLGYYSRVRNLAKAAKLLCAEYDGQLPADIALLRKIPGIGDYTAGAIASIAFGKAVPAVDGNVLRVFARVTGYREDIRSDSFRKQVAEQLRKALSAYITEKTFQSMMDSHATTVQSAPGRFNQAVMDIGATVCIPNGKPHCDVCPLSHLCKAFAEDLTGEIPKKAVKKARPVEKKTVLLIRCGEYVLLHRRPQKGLLAGMWELPNVEGHLSARAVAKTVSELLKRLASEPNETDEKPGQEIPLKTHRLEDSRHVFSHVEWEMRGYRITVKNDNEYLHPVSVESNEFMQSTSVENDEYGWFTPEEIADKIGLPQAFHAYKLQL